MGHHEKDKDLSFGCPTSEATHPQIHTCSRVSLKIYFSEWCPVGGRPTTGLVAVRMVSISFGTHKPETLVPCFPQNSTDTHFLDLQ